MAGSLSSSSACVAKLHKLENLCALPLWHQSDAIRDRRSCIDSNLSRLR